LLLNVIFKFLKQNDKPVQIGGENTSGDLILKSLMQSVVLWAGLSRSIGLWQRWLSKLLWMLQCVWPSYK